MFLTFIPVEHTAASLDIHGIMMNMLKENKMTMDEFWNLPLSTILEYTGMLAPPEKKPISRKKLLQRERNMNMRQQMRVH